MKAKLSILILLFIAGKSFSQAYVPMLNNSSWIVEVANFGGSQIFAINPDGEQVVGAYTYKKFTESNGVFLLREDVASKKVYKIIGGVDTLFFDFSLQVSDHITLANGNTYLVVSINNINVNGGQRRQFYLSNLDNSFGFSEIWIEGVGNQDHPLYARFEQFSDPVYYLKCSFQNGENIYNQGLADNGVPTDCAALGVVKENYPSSKISFTPNPLRTELIISSEISLKNSSLKMYNSIGQIVKEADHLDGKKIILNRGNLKSGIYFVQLRENGELLAANKIMIID